MLREQFVSRNKDYTNDYKEANPQWLAEYLILKKYKGLSSKTSLNYIISLKYLWTFKGDKCRNF